MRYPQFQELADPDRIDQGVAGFLDHIMKPNFAAFVAQAALETRQPVLEIERVGDDGRINGLDDARFEPIETLIVISFDSLRTEQAPSEAELRALRAFLGNRGRRVVIALHHDVGAAEHLSDAERRALQEAQFHHHGDRTLPPQQRFGGFGRAILAGLGIPVENRFGLHPAAQADGSPAPLKADRSLDHFGLLEGVTTLNRHPHLPHLARLGDAMDKLNVLARQRIDLTAPAHPFTHDGRDTFDALLQSRPGVFAADLLVSDATVWSSTNGGVESLRKLWSNMVERGGA